MKHIERSSVTKCLFAVVILLSLTPVYAIGKASSPAAPRKLAIEMGAPFHDHAVLQRQMAVPVWGWSRQGATITVKFAGQKKTANAGPDGKWMVKLA